MNKPDQMICPNCSSTRCHKICIGTMVKTKTGEKINEVYRIQCKDCGFDETEIATPLGIEKNVLDFNTIFDNWDKIKHFILHHRDEFINEEFGEIE